MSSPRPKILLLAHRLPYPPDKGDRIRTFHVLEFHSGRTQIFLACLADEPVPHATVEELNRYCTHVAIIPIHGWKRRLRALASLALGGTATVGAFYEPTLSALLRDWGRQHRFHALLASASSMIPYLRLPEFNSTPAVIDLIDVDSEKWHDYAKAHRWPLSWLYRTEGRRLRRLERALPSWARAATLVSVPETDIFRSFCPWDRIVAVPNGVDLQYFQPLPQAGDAGCVFTGALDYSPNIQGMIWFCREVWPAIHRARPDCQLTIVGRRPVPAVLRLGGVAGVEVVGQVPDVRPYLARAAVAVAPLQIARGIQNKVLEALAMAKAVVASPQALEGLQVQPGVQAVAASTPDEWRETILGLLADADMRRRLGSAGRAYVESRHSWETCLRPFADLLGLPESS